MSPSTAIIVPELMAELKLTLVVACALIDIDRRVLIAQRPEGKTLAGLWEFPGGKVELGERPEVTLIRELREEIGITVEEPCLAPLTFAGAGRASWSRARARPSPGSAPTNCATTRCPPRIFR